MELYKSNNTKLEECENSISLIKRVHNLIKTMNSRTQNGALRINSPEENVRIFNTYKKKLYANF